MKRGNKSYERISKSMVIIFSFSVICELFHKKCLNSGIHKDVRCKRIDFAGSSFKKVRGVTEIYSICLSLGESCPDLNVDLE